ncbi:MAG: hypothetical protein A2X49_08685 [Lentisphaerae bacterium GWF2_52_8]|nr:MAG: hypothetical protein A2X49_08685 [Lentisphaerae bacterium GWF2_52_8]
MNNPKLIYFQEPQLTFAHLQKTEDPRDGLTLFGPFTSQSVAGAITVGIIGPRIQINYLRNYLVKIHNPVISDKTDIARPFFPGVEAALGISINSRSIQEIELKQCDIDTYLKYTDSHQRVFNLSSLYADELRKFCNSEHVHVDVWFVVIPQSIYTLCRPKSRVPRTDDTINIGLAKCDRNSDQPSLFEEDNELKAAYQYELNFHNQLKAKLLNDKIITQIVRDQTIAYKELLSSDEKINQESKFDSAKAWNIATTLYYKAGGIPWKLGEIRRQVCYLGLVYKKIDSSPDERKACCAAQMFLDSGDGMVFRGNIGPWYNPETKQCHIARRDACDLLKMSLQSFQEKLKYLPEEIFIHARTYFDDEEWSGFLDATQGKCKIVGIRIRDDNHLKLYRRYQYAVPRGASLILSDVEAYLWTKGYVPRLQTQLGLEVPSPLYIQITRGEADINTVCHDIFALTKLNYNACIFGDGEPVTLRFADSIGNILTAGPNVTTEVLSFKHYL